MKAPPFPGRPNTRTGYTRTDQCAFRIGRDADRRSLHGNGSIAYGRPVPRVGHDTANLSLGPKGTEAKTKND